MFSRVFLGPLVVLINWWSEIGLLNGVNGCLCVHKFATHDRVVADSIIWFGQCLPTSWKNPVGPENNKTTFPRWAYITAGATCLHGQHTYTIRITAWVEISVILGQKAQTRAKQSWLVSCCWRICFTSPSSRTPLLLHSIFRSNPWLNVNIVINITAMIGWLVGCIAWLSLGTSSRSCVPNSAPYGVTSKHQLMCLHKQIHSKSSKFFKI